MVKPASDTSARTPAKGRFAPETLPVSLRIIKPAANSVLQDSRLTQTMGASKRLDAEVTASAPL
jgi:hypothetical protein